MYRKYFSEQIIYFTYKPNSASGQPTNYHYDWFFDRKAYFDNFNEREITCTTRLWILCSQLWIAFSVSERINKPNLGADHLTFEGEYGWFQKKNYRADFECKNILPGNTFHKMALYIPSPEVSGKKQFLRKPNQNHLYPHPSAPQSQMVGPSDCITNDHRTTRGLYADVQL